MRELGSFGRNFETPKEERGEKRGFECQEIIEEIGERGSERDKEEGKVFSNEERRG